MMQQRSQPILLEFLQDEWLEQFRSRQQASLAGDGAAVWRLDQILARLLVALEAQRVNPGDPQKMQ